MSWGGGSLWERTRSRGVNPHTYQQRRSAHVALIRKGHRRVDLALAPGSFAAESGDCSFFCACYRWSAARVLSYANCEAKCLPQKHPATLCYTGHSHVLKFFTSIHHSNREIVLYGGSTSLQRCDT